MCGIPTEFNPWRKDKASWWSSPVGVSALTMLVGWQEGNPAHMKPVPLFPKGSFPEQMVEGTGGNELNHGELGNWPWKWRGLIDKHPTHSCLLSSTWIEKYRRDVMTLLEQIIVDGVISSRVTSRRCLCYSNSTVWRPCCFVHLRRCSSIRQVTKCYCQCFSRVACIYTGTWCLFQLHGSRVAIFHLASCSCFMNLSRTFFLPLAVIYF